MAKDSKDNETPHDADVVKAKDKDKPVRIRDAEGFRLRACGICVRDDTETEILLVSSGRSHPFWVIPGGGIEDNEDGEQAAIRECMEEAGVKASMIRQTGSYQDDERKNKTDVYLLRVAEELESWEDLHRIGRKRCWFTLEDALKKLKESQKQYLDGLRQLDRNPGTTAAANDT